MIINNTLSKYELMSGQKVNMGKSEMVFSPHIDTATKLNFQANLLILITSSIPKYLGLPTQFGKNSKGGKRDTYLLKVEVFLLEQWPRLSQFML